MIQPFTVTPRTPSRFITVTVPLPKGLWRWETGVTPFRAYDGMRELVCQTERIMRHPDQPAASVALYVDCGVGQAPKYIRVEWDPHREGVQEEAERAAFQWHPEIVRERDRFSATVASLPTMNGPVVKQHRYRSHGALLWFTFFANSPAFRVDAIFHNGQPKDEEVYRSTLGSLASRIPEGWEIHWSIVEPLGDPSGWIVDDEEHFIPQRSMRIVRAVIHPKDYGDWTEARWDSGWATVPHLWQTTWAWAPHFIPCPDLSWKSGLAFDQMRAHDDALHALTTGAQYPRSGNYPVAIQHGFFHPQGSQEGGMTSGSGITYGPAGDIVQTGEPQALMRAFMEQRMWRDRDRTACISAEGDPITYEDVQGEIDSGKIRFSADDPGRFDKSGSVVLDGSLGWSRQIPAPDSPERKALLGFEAVDWAHRIRATYWDLALLHLANDPVSRFLVRQDGELARMAWHSGGRQKGDRGAAQAGVGLPVDRIRGWQLHAMAAAYAAGNNALRKRFKLDMAIACEIYADATRNGPTLCALTGGKQTEVAPYNKQYAVCVAIQEGLLTQGFVAVARALGDTMKLGRILKAVRFLLRGQQTVWSAAVWAKSDRQPFTARRDDLDSHAWATGAYDSEQTRGLVGLVALLTEDETEREEAVALMKAMLGASPRAALRKMNAGALDSDSVALAAADRLGLP